MKKIRSLIEYIINDFIIKWMVKQVDNIISTSVKYVISYWMGQFWYDLTNNLL